MAAITANTGSNNWNTNAAWVGGVQPAAADDVTIPASAVVTIPAATTVLGRSVTVQASGTLAFAATTSTLSIGTSTAGAGNVALSVDTSATITLTAVGTINFISTSTTIQTITSGGKTLPNWTVNGVGSKYQLADGNTTASSATVTLTSGTLDTNGQACTWFQYSSPGAVVRTLTLGASSITMSGGASAWSMATPANYTFNAGTSTITFSGTSARCQFFNNSIFNNLVFTGLSPSFVGNAAVWSCTVNNLTVTGTAVKTGVFLIGAGATSTGGGTVTVSGTLTITGNSSTNRLLVQSASGNGANVGGPITISCATAPSLTNVDFMDIAGAGTAAPFTGTSLGDALGNSGITFDAPVTRYGVVAGNWSSTAMWSTSSGGAGGASVPLSQDTVILDANSGAGTYAVDMPRVCKDLNCTGFTRTLGWAIGNGLIFGSLTLAPGISNPGLGGGVSFAGRGACTITSAGNLMPCLSNQSVGFSGPGGTYTLQDTFTHTNQIRLLNGTLNTNGMTVNCVGLIDVGTAARSFVFGTSTINLGAGNFSVSATGMTMSAASATFVFNTVSTATRSFTGAGFSYGILTYTVANSPGALTIVGANTFNNLNVSSGRTLTMPSSTVNTINSGGSFNVNGVNNGCLYLPGVISNYVSTPDSAALSITGDITIDMKLAIDDWTPAIAQQLLSKNGNGSPNLSYDLSVLSGGQLRFRSSTNGTTSSTLDSVATGIADGAVKWIRVSVDVDDGSGNRLAKFYLSDDGSTWSQLGSSVPGVGTTSIFDSSSILEIGSTLTGTSSLILGKVYNVKFYNSYLQNSSGTPVFDANFTTKAFGANSFVESSANAATVTINGTLAQAGDGRVSLVSSIPGTPAMLSKISGTVSVDYLSIQDSTATGGAAWYAGANSVNVSGNSGWIFGALGATATGRPNFLPFFGGSF